MTTRALPDPIPVQSKDAIGPEQMKIEWVWDAELSTFSPSRMTILIIEGTSGDGDFIQLGRKVVSIDREQMPDELKTALNAFADRLLQEVIKDEYRSRT